MGDLDKLSWPVSRLGEVLEALARTGGLAPRSVEAPPPPHNLARDGAEGLGRWIEATAAAIVTDGQGEPDTRCGPRPQAPTGAGCHYP